MTMTPAQAATIATAKVELQTFYEGAVERMGYLWSRWMDEREYEDWKTYAAEYAKLVEGHPNLTFKKATKSPMGFVATYAPLARDVQFVANGTRCGWKVVPIKA